jgi:putative colanic acid biosynthesis acetyltransferase WcaF
MIRTVDNSTYRTTHDPGAGKVRQIVWYFVNLIFFKSAWNVSSGLKIFLLRLFGAKVGSGVVIKPAVNIKYPWKLVVGEYAWIGEGCWIDNLSDVLIGSSVTLSQGCLLLTGSHDHTKSTFDFLSQPIHIEDGVWIGARAVVYGGVRIHTHAILGINAVAESDLQPYTIYKGNPAVPVLIRKIIQ